MAVNNSCVCVVKHLPKPATVESHALVPESWGTVRDCPVVILCPSAHRNVHVLLDLYLEGHGDVSWEHLRTFSPYIRDVALRGWLIFSGSGMYHR